MITQKNIVRKMVDGNCEIMPGTKIEAFLKEFPWVKDALDAFMPWKEKPISRVYVSGIEDYFLTYNPEVISIPGDLFSDGIYHFERIFLLDKWHKVITYKKTALSPWKYLFFWPRASKIHEHPAVISKCSVDSFIRNRFGNDARVKIDTVHFILSYYSATEAVIIYKIPKKASLLVFMEDAEKVAREKFKHEMEC